MAGIIDLDIGSVAHEAFGLIDKLFTSDEERAEAKRKLLEQEGQQTLKDMQTRLSAILAEAQSTDPWTSRARPSFQYVMYLLILWCIPMGLLYAYDPAVAQNVISGMRTYLAGIPDSMWALFGAGYLGYAGMRSWDKKNGKAK